MRTIEQGAFERDALEVAVSAKGEYSSFLVCSCVLVHVKSERAT